MELNIDEVEAIKILIGNCDRYLISHILSKTLSDSDMTIAERTLLYLYNKIIRETEGD